jgi:hypothetical protein
MQRVRARLTRWRHRARAVRDRGAITAEYAVIMLVAVGFAGVLLSILTGGAVKGLLLGLVQRALRQV